MGRNPELDVWKLLQMLANDGQLTQGSPDYCGYINCSIDFFSNENQIQAFAELINDQSYYESMMKALELDFEERPDLHEAIFVKSSNQF